jgi:hypothetical protein
MACSRRWLFPVLVLLAMSACSGPSPASDAGTSPAVDAARTEDASWGLEDAAAEDAAVTDAAVADAAAAAAAPADAAAADAATPRPPGRRADRSGELMTTTTR